MPTAPLTPVVDSSSGGTPSVSVAAPVEAFGGAVGHALSGLGSQLHSSSDLLWQRALELQDIQNKTEVDKADSTYMEKTGLIHAEFGALEGGDRAKAFPKYIQDIKQIRQQIRDGMSSPATQKMFDTTSLSTLGRTIFNGAGAAASGTREAYKASLDARQAQTNHALADDPENPELRKKSTDIATLRATTRGLDEAVAENYRTENTASVNLESLRRVMQKNPLEGKAMLDRYKAAGGLPGDAYDKATALYEKSAYSIGTDQIATIVTEDLKSQTDPDRTGATEQERIQQARDIAAKQYPELPLMQTEVEKAVRTHYNSHLSAVRDLSRRDTLLYGDILEGHYSPDGRKPTTITQVKEAPGGGDMLERLTHSQMDRLKNGLLANSRGDTIVWNDETRNNYKTVKGMADQNPVEFQAMDIESQKLPPDAKKEMINLQLKMNKQPAQSDPKVARAMQMLRPDLEAAGISTKSDKEGFWRFAGGLQDALNIEQKDNKKPPTLDEVRKIGSRLMQEQITDKGWLWDSKAPLYNVPLTDDRKKELSADPYWKKNNIVPTDDQLRRIHAAQEYSRLYGGAKKATP